MADRAGLRVIGLLMAGLTASVVLIAAVLVYKSAAGLSADQMMSQTWRIPA
jgi:hypothetical protein